MPVENNPLDPSNTGGTVIPVTPVKTIDHNEVLAQIKAALPLIIFAYGVWDAYMDVTKQGLTNTIYKDADALIQPILQKKPEDLTNAEIEQFIGAGIAVLEQAGKDVIQKLTPFLGSDILTILSAFGLLAV